MDFFKGLGICLDAFVEFFSFIPKAFSYLASVMIYMPSQITLFMMATIGCSAILLVLGRGKTA